MNIIKKYVLLIDAIITDFLKDLSHFRVQLVYVAYLFNLMVLYAVIFRGLDYKSLGISFGVLGTVYLFYFSSKHSEAKCEHEIKLKNMESESENEEDSE